MQLYGQDTISYDLDKTPSALTTAMASHLLLKHNICCTDAGNVDQTQQQAAAGQRGSITQFATPQRSREEWMTRLVVVDGLSAHQVDNSEFIDETGQCEVTHCSIQHSHWLHWKNEGGHQDRDRGDPEPEKEVLYRYWWMDQY